MNAYQKAQQLNLTGTPQEIVDQLKAIPLHHRNVYITGGPSDTESVNLLHLLTARHRVMIMGTNQQWLGDLITLEASNAEVAGIMAVLRPHLQVNDTQVYCAASVEAANMLNALTTIVGSLTGKSQQVADEVALLSGGRIGADYASLTAAEYSAQKAEAEAAAARSALHAIADAQYEAFVEKHNAAKAGIDAGTLTTEAALLAVYEG